MLSYKLLEWGAAWLNRRGIARRRLSFLELARRDLGGEPLSESGRAAEDLLLAARVQDTVVRVSEQHTAGDFGAETSWLVDIEDPAFDAPRVELPAMVEALRKTAVLPADFSLEPGRLRYAESAKSIQSAIDRIRALLELLDPAAPVAQSSESKLGCVPNFLNDLAAASLGPFVRMLTLNSVSILTI